MEVRKKLGVLAASVAGLLASAGIAFSGAQQAQAQEGEAMAHCYGINKCAGTGACGGMGHSCAGQNACQGQGYLELSEETCLKIQGGRLTPEPEDEPA